MGIRVKIINILYLANIFKYSSYTTHNLAIKLKLQTTKYRFVTNVVVKCSNNRFILAVLFFRMEHMTVASTLLHMPLPLLLAKTRVSVILTSHK